MGLGVNPLSMFVFFLVLYFTQVNFPSMLSTCHMGKSGGGGDGGDGGDDGGG